jgi:hypothetical protein
MSATRGKHGGFNRPVPSSSQLRFPSPQKAEPLSRNATATRTPGDTPIQVLASSNPWWEGACHE